MYTILVECSTYCAIRPSHKLTTNNYDWEEIGSKRKELFTILNKVVNEEEEEEEEEFDLADTIFYKVNRKVGKDIQTSFKKIKASSAWRTLLPRWLQFFFFIRNTKRNFSPTCVTFVHDKNNR